MPARRWFALCVLAGALLPALGTAQSLGGQIVTVLKSGLHSVFEGHALLLTVTEVGSTASTSNVTIEFRNAADLQRAFTSRTLSRKHPVHLGVPIPAGAGREQLRVIVKITPLTSGESSAPIVGLEDLDIDSFQAIPKVICATAEPIPSIGPEADCGGWLLTRVTALQASAPD